VEGKRCYATLNTLDHICPDCGVKKVFEDGVARDSHEYSHIGIDGKPHYVELIATPLKDKVGNVIAALEFVVDIAEKKRMQQELQASETKFRVINEKLRVVGSLTRHDVRNKLLAVNVYTYLLKKNHADQADIVEGSNKIEQLVKDSSKIFEFAKMYEQLGVEELKYVDIGNVVNEAVALFSSLTILVVNNCHGVGVLADSFLRQMFYNFIDNTLKYGVKATVIKVYCENKELGGLRLIYEDDGVGISEENKSMLFSEGFSTGGSTGFGLFFIKKMIGVYGWSITEEGEPGKGAKFVISIPTRSS
jgi:signal transduction histidine kinase